jgi:hypothetical protein
MRRKGIAQFFAAWMLLAACVECVYAQTQDPLIVRMAANENAMLARIGKQAPLVETYLQVVARNGESPVSDRYYLHRIDLGSAIRETMYDQPERQRSKLSNAWKFAGLSLRRAPTSFNSSGFVEMLSPDIRGFDPGKFKFEFLHNEFIGNVKTAVYDVFPAKAGYFRGRFWIDEHGNLVRFTGVFAGNGSESHPLYLHFDSWRLNVKPGVWLPAAIYVEEPVPEGIVHGQIRLWGYGLDARLHDPLSSVTVSVDNAVDRSGDGTDMDPLASLQAWKDLAASNILDKLERAGILAPHSSFDSVLDQIVVNLSVPSDLTFAGPVHCRVMLTTPIEATTVGSTILISKGLIETLPNEESIASVVAFELAHVIQSNTVDTRYSFADRTMFPDRKVSRDLYLAHSGKEDEMAAEVAVSLIQKSMYGDKLGGIGLYYQQMALGIGKLNGLYRPETGDSLISPAGKPWLLAQLAEKSPRLEPGNPRQLAALPLGSNLVVDPWTGEVRLSDAPRVMPQTASEKRPFEVVPVYFRLRAAPEVAFGIGNTDTVIVAIR